MNVVADPFETVATEDSAGDLKVLSQKSARPLKPFAAVSGAVTARFHGFDLEDRPLVCDLPGRSREIVAARTTIALARRDAGSPVVVLFEQGNQLRPIVIGLLQETRPRDDVATTRSGHVSIEADSECFVVSAEREIVLRCGDASITLTRAGKVIIKGKHILSRSTGYNKIKGAAVDIN